jgi:hypothetical protein
MLPFAPIASLLIELDVRTGFLDCFTPASIGPTGRPSPTRCCSWSRPARRPRHPRPGATHPRRVRHRIAKHLGIGRSTFYRALKPHTASGLSHLPKEPPSGPSGSHQVHLNVGFGLMWAGPHRVPCRSGGGGADRTSRRPSEPPCRRRPVTDRAGQRPLRGARLRAGRRRWRGGHDGLWRRTYGRIW